MKLYKLCAFALCLLLAVCSVNIEIGDTPEAGAVAPVPREITPPVPAAAITGDTGGAVRRCPAWPKKDDAECLPQSAASTKGGGEAGKIGQTV